MLHNAFTRFEVENVFVNIKLFKAHESLLQYILNIFSEFRSERQEQMQDIWQYCKNRVVGYLLSISLNFQCVDDYF